MSESGTVNSAWGTAVRPSTAIVATGGSVLNSVAAKRMACTAAPSVGTCEDGLVLPVATAGAPTSGMRAGGRASVACGSALAHATHATATVATSHARLDPDIRR